MTGESFERSLVQRAELAMRAEDTGEGFVSWDKLTEMSSLDVRATLETLIEEGARMGLVVQFLDRKSPDPARDGLVVRWKPRRRP